jgi:hypothetical protein
LTIHLFCYYLKEFYIPTVSSSVHFLKSKLCIGCQKGFEIVNLETLDVLGLLDPADHSLDFVARREAVKPISIFRIEAEFLLCYEEFAFYVRFSLFVSWCSDDLLLNSFISVFFLCV